MSGGFTLLELMTVIAVLGILATIALPSFKYLGANTKVKSAATDLYLSMLRARSEAVKRSSLVWLRAATGGWANGWQVVADSNGNGTYDAGTDRLVYDSAALSGITVSVTSSITSLTYLTSGRVQGAVAPIFTIASPKVSSVGRCVSLDLTGRPYVAKKGETGCP